MMNAMQKEKQEESRENMQSKLKAQTSLEYILIIAAGLILIVIIVYVINSGVLNPNTETGKIQASQIWVTIDSLNPPT